MGPPHLLIGRLLLSQDRDRDFQRTVVGESASRLTRLTGLKAADSVKGLTAAVNGFGKAGLTTTQIINKLSAVDVKFAVGTDDLIDALSRAVTGYCSYF